MVYTHVCIYTCVYVDDIFHKKTMADQILQSETNEEEKEHTLLSAYYKKFRIASEREGLR